ncbi:hypothetical protein OQA88_299 [Cercophora sp. LCS_1]
MKAHRPQRGRVSKPSAPARGRPGRAAGAQLAHDVLEHQLKADPVQDPSLFDDPSRMGPEQYAAAAAAAAVMDADMAADASGDAEAEADMEDDDPAATGSGLAPHVDLTTAASILANSNQSMDDQQHQDLQQQGLAHVHHHQPQAQMGVSTLQQAGQQLMDPSLMKTTQQLASESGYKDLNIESALAKRLAREPGHRIATQRRPEQSLNLGRRSNVEALFAHIAGTPARVPCKNCHKGHGPWLNCIVVDGQIGARCSFHETRTLQATQQHPNIISGTTAGLPVDSSYRFATPHGLMPTTPGPSLGNMGHPSMFTSTPTLQNLLARSMAEVRAADKATRKLMQIEIAAKQLALQIADYEEMVGGQEGQGQGQQQIMDDSGA